MPPIGLLNAPRSPTAIDWKYEYVVCVCSGPPLPPTSSVVATSTSGPSHMTLPGTAIVPHVSITGTPTCALVLCMSSIRGPCTAGSCVGNKTEPASNPIWMPYIAPVGPPNMNPTIPPTIAEPACPALLMQPLESYGEEGHPNLDRHWSSTPP